MKLHEIIEINDGDTGAILIDKIAPYKKSLQTYYGNQFVGECMLMVVSVTNATQYVKIVDANEFMEAVYAYMEVDYVETDSDLPDFDEDLFAHYETIYANSIMFDKL